MQACRNDASSFCQLEMSADLGDMFYSKENRTKLFSCLFTLSTVRKQGKLSSGCISALDRMEIEKKKHSSYGKRDVYSKHGYCPCTEDIKNVCGLDIHNGSFALWGYSDVNKSHFSKKVNECTIYLNQAKENGMLSPKCYAAIDHGDSVKKDLETCRDDVYSICEVQMPQDLGQWFSSKEGREI